PLAGQEALRLGRARSLPAWLVGFAGRGTHREQRHSLGARDESSFGAWANSNKHQRFQRPLLSAGMESRAALEYYVDFLLSVFQMVVLGVVGAARIDLAHVHSPCRYAQLATGRAKLDACNGIRPLVVADLADSLHRHIAHGASYRDLRRTLLGRSPDGCDVVLLLPAAKAERGAHRRFTEGVRQILVLERAGNDHPAHADTSHSQRKVGVF